MDIFFNEEKGAWDVLEPPYCTVLLQTKEDYDRFREMLDFWKAYHKDDGAKNEQREKLFELLQTWSQRITQEKVKPGETFADHLIANGVVVLPCRCIDCDLRQSSEECECRPDDFFCGDAIRKAVTSDEID